MNARIAVLVPALGLLTLAAACGGGGSKPKPAAAIQPAASRSLATVAAAATVATAPSTTAAAPTGASTAPPAAAVASSTTKAAAAVTAASAPSAAAAARPAGGKPGAIDPCTLLKREEVEAAFSQPFKQPETSVAKDVVPIAAGVTATLSSCTFDADGLSANHVELNLDQFSGGTADQRRQLIDFICSKKERISGLGDGACWYDSSHNELQVVKGSNLIDINAIKGLNADSSAVTLSLAKQALTRLP